MDLKVENEKRIAEYKSVINSLAQESHVFSKTPEYIVFEGVDGAKVSFSFVTYGDHFTVHLNGLLICFNNIRVSYKGYDDYIELELLFNDFTITRILILKWGW